MGLYHNAPISYHTLVILSHANNLVTLKSQMIFLNPTEKLIPYKCISYCFKWTCMENQKINRICQQRSRWVKNFLDLPSKEKGTHFEKEKNTI